MGALFYFKCEKCGYTAEVSGGKDSGFFISTETKMCSNCRRIVDTVIGPGGRNMGINSTLKTKKISVRIAGILNY